jgi:hypothetical protein
MLPWVAENFTEPESCFYSEEPPQAQTVVCVICVHLRLRFSLRLHENGAQLEPGALLLHDSVVRFAGEPAGGFQHFG